MTIRSIAESISRNFVFERSFSERFNNARMFVSPEGGLRYWRPNLEKTDPILLDAVENLVKPGSVVWDIGANVGLFSLAAAARAGRSGLVLSIDADEWLTALVRRSISLNATSLAPIHQLTAAVSDAPGFARFHITKRARATSHLEGCGASPGLQSREVRVVRTVTLDGLAASFPLPHVMKVDVEGAESLVLTGGKRMLAEAKPTLFIEVGERSSATVTKTLVDELGYHLFDVSHGFNRPSHVQSAVWNTLAIPSDHSKFRH